MRFHRFPLPARVDSRALRKERTVERKFEPKLTRPRYVKRHVMAIAHYILREARALDC